MTIQHHSLHDENENSFSPFSMSEEFDFFPMCFAGHDIQHQTAAATAEGIVAPAARHARILVADDEPRIRLAMRSCLEAEGYAIDEAADGVQALDAIERSLPDLMLLDLAMPNMDGIRTLKQLQYVPDQLKPPVIILTAWGSEPAMLQAIGLGAALYLEKPIDPETLRQAVRVVLERASDQDASGGPIAR